MLKHIRWNDVELEKLNPLLDRQMITGENLMLARVLLKKGCVVPEHSHMNEQLTYIVEGALKFWIDGKEIIVRGHSVRATEALVKEQKSEPAAATPKANPEKTRHVQSIEDELRQALALRVEIRVKGKDRGQIILNFESNDDFETLLEVLRRPAKS